MSGDVHVRFCESAGVRFPRATLLICAFQYESDARRFQSVLPKRLSRFSLELADEKTKLLRFGRFAERDSARHGEGSPGTFDFLGFTHYCGHSRARKFKLKRKTAKKKLRMKIRDLKEWFRANLTTPVEEVWTTLNQKLRGHYQYYGVSDNWPWLMLYREAAMRLARRWFRRRSQRGKMDPTFFYTVYIRRHPVAEPRRILNLIA